MKVEYTKYCNYFLVENLEPTIIIFMEIELNYKIRMRLESLESRKC